MTHPIRVLVVDDEPPAREGMVALLERLEGFEAIGTSANGRAALEDIERLDPDLVLLDIQMPEMDGFEVIRAVGPDRMPPLVFITAYDEYALRAFEVNAIDYLLKPFDDARFAMAMNRAAHVVREGDLGALTRRLLGVLGDPVEDVTSPGPFLTRIVVKKTRATLLVPVEDVDWIEAADYCVRIHASGKTHVVREAMHRLERRLDPQHFFRAHRSGIVNLDRVAEIAVSPSGELVMVLHSGARVRLSRSRRTELERRLGQAL